MGHLLRECLLSLANAELSNIVLPCSSFPVEQVLSQGPVW